MITQTFVDANNCLCIIPENYWEYNMITEKQRLQRKKGIGASDSPIIMGFSSYKTPLVLYMEKLGLINDTHDETELQYWGNELESVVRDHFSRFNNVEVTTPDTLVSEKYSHMLANLDGFIPEWNAVLEVKCSDKYMRNEWGPDDTDIIPMQYLVQVAHQCIVANADRGYIAVLIGGNEYRQFCYNRDAELEKLIIDASKEFWYENVLQKKEPDCITIDDARLKYRTTEPGKTINPDAFTLTHLNALRDARDKRVALQIIENGCKLQIMEYMKDAEALVDETGTPMVTLKPTVKGSRVFLLK